MKKRILLLFFIALLMIFTACNTAPAFTSVDEIEQNDESGDISGDFENDSSDVPNEATEKGNENYADATVERNEEHNGEAGQTGEQPNRFDQPNGSSNTTESDNGRKIELPAVDF